VTPRAGARRHRPRLAQLLALAVALAACDRGPPRGGPPADPAPPADSAEPLRRVSLSQIPAGPPGDSIRRGRALLLNTHDSLPAHAPSPRIRCQSCHLDGGQRPNAGPWIGVSARYPQYRARPAASSPSPTA
jgi:cytochrome c